MSLAVTGAPSIAATTLSTKRTSAWLTRSSAKGTEDSEET